MAAILHALQGILTIVIMIELPVFICPVRAGFLKASARLWPSW